MTDKTKEMLQSVEINGESFFTISNLENIRPFFMSVVSDSDHWMFISSNGGLSAGRKNAEFSLFPYITDDKITDLAHITGSKTILQVNSSIWEPFCKKNAIKQNITRNLYKNKYGNKIIFEEVNHEFELTFRYEWNSSDQFGFVRKSTLTNNSDKSCSVTIVDGIQNILPASTDSDLQNRSSNLLDAYKRSELVKETSLAIYALSAIPVDKAEPSEALKANVVWSLGTNSATYLLSSLQLDHFRDFKTVEEETDVKGEKGAYFIKSELELSPESESSWWIMANTNLDHAGVIRLNKEIREADDLCTIIQEDIERGTQNLKNLVAASDGFQYTADELRDARHYSNVLFNIMRGGIFDDNYQIEKSDFLEYLRNANKEVFGKHNELFAGLPDEFDKNALDEHLAAENDPDLIRLAKEYLPLKFSRRHGDPSRPWNKFSINTRDENDGSKVLDYEGNWRDIFQNWEALVHSYPKFIEGMIFKFLNATTFDGYNPYRVTKGGFDWEVIEPDDPWSYIGYWGDHQIIYLLKFLEFYHDHQPEAFEDLYSSDLFVYANVPYRIKSYERIVENPKDTIDFDHKSDAEIQDLVEQIGADGALLSSKTDSIHRVNFIEKILATSLSKLSNFIPEGGIWMNTQRPEWNDANNALVGNGVSMVTLYYLRRFLKFFEPLLSSSKGKEVQVSEEMAEFFNSIRSVFESHSGSLSASVDDKTRKDITDGLGKAGSVFRDRIYDNGFSGKKATLSLESVHTLFSVATQFLEHSINANKREDDLYHAYNIMSVEEDGISISYLDEMLEGQVAVLSSGYLSASESLKVLEALRESSLYRKDQMSYILYPNKELPGFLDRNSVPEALVEKSSLLIQMVSKNDRRIISKDINGGYHFNGAFKNAAFLEEALDKIEDSEYSGLAKTERKTILSICEKVFNHKAFTGRSGTFYAFEGLGSIYWHMVSKLYLATMEVGVKAAKEKEDSALVHELASQFHEIGEGIGVHKSPELYGAFPTDPYSHTPYHRGAQQPGMTGQVKEDILARYGELGIEVTDGFLSFSPSLLSTDEFLESGKDVELISLDHERYIVHVPANALCFTLCQVPVFYQLSTEEGIMVEYSNGETKSFNDLKLDAETSNELFTRSGLVSLVKVSFKKERLT
ncbi:MAG: hypothetical protein ACMZ7B_07375 [Balneola sp.]